MRRALEIDEASHAPSHPDLALRLYNLAGFLYRRNRFAEAEPLYRRALAIDEASCGPDHPNVANDLWNLAELLLATNRLVEAEPLYRRALAIDEANYGPDHAETLARKRNLLVLANVNNSTREPKSAILRRTNHPMIPPKTCCNRGRRRRSKSIRHGFSLRCGICTRRCKSRPPAYPSHANFETCTSKFWSLI